MVSIGPLYSGNYLACPDGRTPYDPYKAPRKHPLPLWHGGLELTLDYLIEPFSLNQKIHRLLQTGIGNVQRKNSTFWLLPLRVWLGLMWLVSGIQKVQNDWWSSSWPLIGLTGSTDATASATITPLTGPHSPNWYKAIAERLIVPNALFFQKLIVIVEIGLASPSYQCLPL